MFFTVILTFNVVILQQKQKLSHAKKGRLCKVYRAAWVIGGGGYVKT